MKRNLRNFLMAACAAMLGTTAWAQTDVTSTYLDNAGFDTESDFITTGVCTYAKDVSGNKADGSSLMAVTGWTAGDTGDAKAGACLGFGSSAWLTGKGYVVPATNSDGNAEGGCLGLGGCWGGNAYYTQDLKQNLGAGTYTIEICAYNGNSATSFGTQTFGIKEANGTTHYVSTIWTANKWVKATLVFEISEETAATFYVGATSVSGGSAASAKLFIDYVKISAGIDLTSWNEAKAAAQTALDSYAASYAATERAAVTSAMSAADPTTVAGLNEAISTLNTAVNTFKAAADAEIETARQNANVEGYNAIKADYQYSYASLLNTDLTQWSNNNYVGNNGSEHWSGVNPTYYYEQRGSEWGAGSWSKAASQTVTLPKGKYAMVTTARASADVTSTMSVKVGDADAVTVNLPNKGASGFGIDTDGNATFASDATYATTSGRGWEYRYIEFEVTEAAGSDVTISFASSTNTVHNWVSIANPILYGSVHPNQINLNKVNSLATELKTYEGNIATSVYSGFATDLTNAANATVESTDLEGIISALTADITSAKTAKAVTDEIKTYLEYEKTTNASVDFSSIDVLSYTASADGQAAIKSLRNSKATESMTAGQDLTGLIDNAGFELGNTNYWTVKASSDTGARDASSDTYKMSGSEGSYVFNTWWQGTPITQNIGTLPAGTYQMSATVASDGATIYLTANDNKSFVETAGTDNNHSYVTPKLVGITGTLTFTLTETTEVTIGVVGGADGTAGKHKDYTADGHWWYKADNFKLTYLGATAPANTLDGEYIISTDGNYIGRGGDSNTEAVATTKANALAATITTDEAGFQTVVFYDNKGYMMWNGENVYTDGTMQPKSIYHQPYWKLTAVEGGYTIYNTEAGKYLTTGTATRDGEEITVVTLSDTPATWVLGDATEAISRDELAAAKAELKAALAAHPTLTHVSTAVFDYENEAGTAYNNTVSTANGVYENASATKVEVETQTAAVKALVAPALNAPSSTQAYKIILKSSGWKYDNCAMTAEAGARSDMGNYNVQYVAQNDNYAQAMYFTQVEDGYNISWTDADGATRYLCTGTVWGGNDGQIRTSANKDDALVVTISRNGDYINLYDVAAGKHIGSQDAGVFPVESHIDFVAEETTATHAITVSMAAGYATVVLPYAATISTGKAYTVKSVGDDDVLEMEEITSLEANKAYVLEGKTDYSFSGVNVAYAAPAANELLTGVYAETVPSAGTYVLQQHGTNVSFYKVADSYEEGEAPVVTANRAYLTLPDASDAAKVLNFPTADATAIDAVNALTSGNAKIYDVNGRQLKQLQKGINIVNGAKVLVK